MRGGEAGSFELSYFSGRWRLLQIHRCRPCFREAEASDAPLSLALVSGVSILGSCDFGLVWLEELSSVMIDALRCGSVVGDGTGVVIVRDTGVNRSGLGPERVAPFLAGLCNTWALT
ncbi:hypothetical protein YC2023_056641 [Brassica napus]